MKFSFKDFLGFQIEVFITVLLTFISCVPIDKNNFFAILVFIILILYVLLRNIIFPNIGNIKGFKIDKTKILRGLIANFIYLILYLPFVFLAFMWMIFIIIPNTVYMIDFVSVLVNKKRLLYYLFRI